MDVGAAGWLHVGLSEEGGQASCLLLSISVTSTDDYLPIPPSRAAPGLVHPRHAQKHQSRPTMLLETPRYTRPAAREVFARVHCLAVDGMSILGQQCAHMGPYQRQAA